MELRLGGESSKELPKWVIGEGTLGGRGLYSSGYEAHALLGISAERIRSFSFSLTALVSSPSLTVLHTKTHFLPNLTFSLTTQASRPHHTLFVIQCAFFLSTPRRLSFFPSFYGTGSWTGRLGAPPCATGALCKKSIRHFLLPVRVGRKERKKTDNPREGWENGTPPRRNASRKLVSLEEP